MTQTQQDTITITIDGKQVECRPGELLIEVAKRAGIYIPYFCYHPRMDPVGACRMCLIDMKPGPPKPQTACTTRVADGMTIETQFANPAIRQAQQGVLEFLLINHPLDCPICDRGGECPLQDQTQDYGPAESRYVEAKRRFEKPVAISPLIKLDRERCILCYRCTRFCEELSGDVLLGIMERGPEAFIFPYYAFDNGDRTDLDDTGPHHAPRGPSTSDVSDVFDSYFSGNTVQICPVGALTSTEYRFMARPWDLQVVPTTCTLCASGCSLHASVRVQDGNVARFSSATNEETNEEWLCDKGRYGNAYISSEQRLTYPYARRGDELVPVSWDEAFDVLAEGLRPVLSGGAKAGMIVGESLCDEDTYTAQKFARMVLRTNNVDHRLEGGLSAEALLRPAVTYDDVLSSDLVVVVGSDLREELPVLFLRLRIAATKKGLPFAIVHPRTVALSEYSIATLRPLPSTEAAVAGAVLATLDDADAAQAVAASGLEADALRPFADALIGASNAVILLGPRAHGAEVIGAWRAVAERVGARVTWTPRRSGTYGALASGAHPDLLPGWRTMADDAACAEVAEGWGGFVPGEPGLDVGGMLRAAKDGELHALWLVGADVLADVPDPSLGKDALERTPFVVVQDVQSTQLLNHADLVFPAATFVERDGTITDWEGRRQAINGAVDPPGAARADYAILAEAARRLERPIGCRTQAQVSAELERWMTSASQPAIVAARPPEPSAAADTESLKLLTYRLLYDAGSRTSRTDGIVALTQASFAELNIADAQARGITDGQQVTVSSSHGSITISARVSDAIRPGVVFVPYNQPGETAQSLCTWDDRNPSVDVGRA